MGPAGGGGFGLFDKSHTDSNSNDHYLLSTHCGIVMLSVTKTISNPQCDLKGILIFYYVAEWKLKFGEARQII